tara:strand:- start:1028 stop:1162 length:135 start_codon:yes stop_codon:yes gene_type:complete
MHITLIMMPMGPLLILEEGLMPKIGSTFVASSSSISEIGFMILP